jgi:hypothetical protein
MVSENNIPKTETIYEIKNEIPSFEELMRDYKTDENLNYDDLSGGSIGEVKGYGPCTDGRSFSECNCSREELWEQRSINITNVTIQNSIYHIWTNRWPGTTPQRISNFRFGYKAINSLFGETISYDRIYESAEDLRDDIHNISTKSGRWATQYYGPFVNRRITDFQASEGYRYAKWALERHDEGYSVNLKCWTEVGTFNTGGSKSQNMGDNWNWNF